MYADGFEYAQDSLREVALVLYPAATPFEVFSGTATGGVDFAPFASALTQSAHEAEVSLAWHDELYGTGQPAPGQVLEIKLQGASYWLGIVQAISDYRLASGEKKMRITARSRDATPAMRDIRRATQIYPTATPIDYIARQIARSVGLDDDEIIVSDTGARTVHSNTQLADVTPWEMLRTIYQPAGLEPYVDCRGRLKCISRETARPSDFVLSDNRRLVSISGSKGVPPLTEYRVRWLDPEFSQVTQVPKKLFESSMTAGFFQLKQQKDAPFSSDGTQRAKNTYLVVRQSCNSGLLPVATERYEQVTPTMGRITLETSAWVPGLATGAIITKGIAHNTPDIAPPSGGPVQPVGRLYEFTADVVLFMTMMSIGTGHYEVWGTPYDYVHARNTTTAFNENAKPWEIKPQETENDFVMNADQAHAFAVRELIYQAASATTMSLTVVDDTRIEEGDIIELRDGSRIYVTGYRRDLSHGAPAVLQIDGFGIVNGAAGAGVDTGAPGSELGTPPTVAPIPVPAPFPPYPTLPLLPPFPPLTPPPAPPPADPGTIAIPEIQNPAANGFRLLFSPTKIRAPGPGNLQIGEWRLPGAVATGVSSRLPLDYQSAPATGTANSSSGESPGDGFLAFGHEGYQAGVTTPLAGPQYLEFSWYDRNEKYVVDNVILSMAGDPPTNFDFQAKGENETQWVTVMKFRDSIAYISPTDGAFSNTWPGESIFTYKSRLQGLNFYRLVLRDMGLPMGVAYYITVNQVQLYQEVGGANICGSGPDYYAVGDCGDALGGDSPDSVFQPSVGRVALPNTLDPDGETAAWVRIQFANSTTVKQYGLVFGLDIGTPRTIREWTFEVSPNGAQWTVVDRRFNVTFAPGVLQKFTLALYPVATN
jgi:hypothetical protein